MKFAASVILAEAATRYDLVDHLERSSDAWMQFLIYASGWLAVSLPFVVIALFLAGEKTRTFKDVGTEEDEWLAERTKQDLFWCNRTKDTRK